MLLPRKPCSSQTGAAFSQHLSPRAHRQHCPSPILFKSQLPLKLKLKNFRLKKAWAQWDQYVYPKRLRSPKKTASLLVILTAINFTVLALLFKQILKDRPLKPLTEGAGWPQKITHEIQTEFKA